MALEFCPHSVKGPIIEFCPAASSMVGSTTTECSDDPYHDEESTGTDNVSTPLLGENMMRKLVNRDPYDIYVPVKMLGTGSMGAVAMVKKRDVSKGGSARIHNLTFQKQLELEGVHPYYVKLFTLPVVGRWFQVCAGLRVPGDKENAMDGPSSSRSYKPPVSMYSSSRSTDNSTAAVNHYDNYQDLDTSYHSTKGVSDIRQQSVSVPKFLLSSNSEGKSESRAPKHFYINAYLNTQRAQGKYDFHYALKSIHLSRVFDPLYISEMKNEIEIMKTLDHCHIVRPLETYEHRGHLYMLMELCSGGDLYSRDPYTEDQACRIVGNLLSAVSYMHEHNIVHRDLKYENIMFVNSNPKAEIKIIDFGLSKKFLPNQKQRMKDGVGTIYTMAPEVLQNDYTSKADVWSIGVLAYMLLSSQMPFYGRKRKEIVDKIANCTYNFRGRRWSYVSEQAKTFVANLIVLNADERPTAEEAKQSMWLNAKHTSSMSSARTEDDMSVVRNSLEQFSQLKKLQKLALMVIAHKSSSEEIGFLRRAFKRYDTDKNGTIELPEFKKCLSKYDYSDEYLQHLFEQVDMDGTGEIKYTEFIAATVQSAGLITEDRLAEAFDRLDSDDSGFITIQNLRDLLGDEVPSEYLEGIMQEADVHKDKRISYADFLELWEEDVEDTNLSALRGISKQRTIKNVIDDLITSSSDEHLTCSDSDPDLAGDKHSAF